MNTPHHWFLKEDEDTKLVYLCYMREGPLRDAPLTEIQIVKYKVSDDMLIVFAKNDLSGYLLDPAHQYDVNPQLFSEVMEFVINALGRHT